MGTKQHLYQLWQQIYKNNFSQEFEAFYRKLTEYKSRLSCYHKKEEWYKDVVVYSLYVDLFNKDFQGLIEKLDDLHHLGVSCIWLLPVLQSPMRDAGFDISDFRKIRPGLLKDDKDFDHFLSQAHNRDIKVIFDIAMNHTSNEHEWFQQAKDDKQSKYRDFYIWSKTPEKYKSARIIFKGLCESNWELYGNEYYFHRFFEFQPDLNYRNPQVLMAMCENLLYWIGRGVDGFRVDAVPYLWKEEKTNCENLPTTHSIVKFFRAVCEMTCPNTLLLAEACQQHNQVVKYFGNGDECQAAYYFPMMPQIFKAIAQEKSDAIEKVIQKDKSVVVPEASQWFTFLRCHDELSLERVYVNEEDRKFIHDAYCRQKDWDFRQGEGISARLSELMDRNPEKILLAYSIMLTLPGTPIIYYGDEYAKMNDVDFYEKMKKMTGKDDTRMLVRGALDWKKIAMKLKDKNSMEGIVYRNLSQMIQIRNKYQAFGKGSVNAGQEHENVLSFFRIYKNEKLYVLHNLSSKEISIPAKNAHEYRYLYAQNALVGQSQVQLKAYGFIWLRV